MERGSGIVAGEVGLEEGEEELMVVGLSGWKVKESLTASFHVDGVTEPDK